jgi:AcrR family transcriptional regulator
VRVTKPTDKSMSSWDNAIATPKTQRELKRRALLRVAGRIFNEKGYYGTSLDEIADALGVTKPALYYYVKSKDALLYECLMLSYGCGQRARLYAEEHGGTAYEKLQLLYKTFMVLLMEERGAYTTMANIAALPDKQQKDLMERRRQLDRYSRTLIRQAIDEGAIRPVDVRVTSNFLLGAVNWILRWYSEDEYAPEEIAAIFLDLMMNGIAVNRADILSLLGGSAPKPSKA